MERNEIDSLELLKFGKQKSKHTFLFKPPCLKAPLGRRKGFIPAIVVALLFLSHRNYYGDGPIRDPVVMKTRLETLKVRRGGNWADQPWILQCANRNYRTTGLRLIGLGFRQAKDAEH
jgi:hypothetical protein